MICFYHSRDLDGFTSGAIVKKAYPDAELIGYDYGQPIPRTKEQLAGQDVILIDVSFPIGDIMEISQVTKSFLWIDHHASAYGDYRNHVPPGVQAVMEIGKAACEIAWKFFYPLQEPPTAVVLLGAYDTWRKDDKAVWDDVIYPFQFGMRGHCTSPETFPDLLLIEYNKSIDATNLISSILREGKAIVQYQTEMNALNCKRNSFEFEFEGLKAICLNGGGFNSDVFKSVYDPEKHDIMMPFQFNGKFWVFSLYDDKGSTDCSALAKKYGGGGHKGAAGFQAESLSVVFGDRVK